MLKFIQQLVQKGLRIHFFVLLVLFLALSLIPVAALGVASSAGGEEIILGEVFSPTFTKTFMPDTIGPGSVSTLRFDIVNDSPFPAEELAFIDNLPTGIILKNSSPTGLPSGVVIATPANVSNSCNGTVTASDGGSVISLTGGDVGGSSSCFITVDVTSSEIGTHTNVTGDLISTAGNSGTATDDLMVVTSLPGFSKSFVPSAIDLGGRSTLTFTIDNSANGGFRTLLIFTDNLPIGMQVANPANASSTCNGGTVTAVSGTDIISHTGGYVFAGATCTVSVDVLATGAGMLINSSGELSSSDISSTSLSSGKANATLDVSFNTLYLTKSFVDDPVPAGATVDLAFTIENQDRLNGATNIAFTDSLETTLTGLAPISLSPNVCGGSLSFAGGTLSLSGASLGSSSSCTFTTTLQLPASAIKGEYPNTTSSVTATVAGTPVMGTKGSDTLFVAPVPLLTKTFINDPVPAGSDVTLQFNITNSSSTSQATDIAFLDELTIFLPFPVSVVFSPNPACGAGSSISLVVVGEEMQTLSLMGGSLAPSASCTFTTTITIPPGFGSGSYLNTTSNVTATVDGDALEGHPATDTLEVVSAPTLRKSFIDDPVLAGDMVTLEFTIGHGLEEPGDATNIAFTDVLSDVLPGLVAVGLPQNDVCGAGSQISGTDTLSFTGGGLTPGEVCVFNVQLQVPMPISGTEILPGNYLNTTSNVTANVLGLDVTGLPGEDNLIVGGLTFTKSFIDDPVIPGDMVTLEFTIENESTTLTTTSMLFTDNLEITLSGLVAAPPLPSEPCGAGSSLTGTSSLIFIGGNLAPSSSCTFSVTLQVPPGVVDGTYSNTTSGFFATIDGSNVVLDPATDKLVVNSNLLSLTKRYVGIPVLPGDTATLRFTLENLHQTDMATNIAFTDDLDASLSGLVALPPLPNEPCGVGSQISGTAELMFTGGTLSAGEVCTFDIRVQVPGTVLLGERYENVTSNVTAIIDGFDVTGDPGRDTLVIGIPPVYLPLVLNDALFAPDLVVTSLDVGGGTVQIVLTNQGTTAVSNSFWVDLYINPSTVPTMVNQTWELVGTYGAVWGVEGAALPLDVGESLTLTLNDAYYRSALSNLPVPIVAGTPIYVQVDSANEGTTYGSVLETHEVINSVYNNILGPVSAASE